MDDGAPPPKRYRCFIPSSARNQDRQKTPEPSSLLSINPSLPPVAQKYISKNMFQYFDNKQMNIMGKCKVCEFSASEVYYGVLACEQCRKCFMKFQGAQSTCPSNGNCEVVFHKHPICKSCRFEKCVRVGMKDEAYVQNPRFPQEIKDIFAIHLKYCDYTRQKIRQVVASDFGFKMNNNYNSLTNRLTAWKLYSEVMERDIETSGRFMQYLENQFEAPDRATLLRKQAFKVYLLKISQSLDYKGLYLPDGRFINFSIFTLLYGYQLANDMVQMAGKIREWISCDEDLAVIIAMCLYSPFNEGILIETRLENHEHLAEVFTEYKRKCRVHFQEKGHSPDKMDRMMNIIHYMTRLECKIDILCNFLGRYRGYFDEDSLFCEIYCNPLEKKGVLQRSGVDGDANQQEVQKNDY